MKIPDNIDIMRFIVKYGYTVVLAIIIFVLCYRFVERVHYTALPVCTVQDMQTGSDVSYKGKQFQVDKFDYNEYSYSNDLLFIHLSSK